MRCLVVGAGFAGAVTARELADSGHEVTVIDRRPHIAGNAFDYEDEQGLRVHRYGPHLFHTSNPTVIDWLSRFTQWTPYEHHIQAVLHDGQYVPFPPNLNTLDTVPRDQIWNVFFEPYSRKMWGEWFPLLEQSVFDRVKIREDRDDRAFRDTFQCMPTHGYTAMFQAVLDHPNIQIQLGCAFDRTMEPLYDHVFNSMAIDEYYDYRFGELPYRSIKFHHRVLPSDQSLPAATVNFTDDGAYTRATEWQKIAAHGCNDTVTTVTYEEPCDWRATNERYYPIITESNRALYDQYRSIDNAKVTFIGRCGNYVYLDMHQVVSSTLSMIRKWLINQKT